MKTWKVESTARRKIAIIGCGGLGCSLGVALGASGIGQIDLVDFDEVGVHNIHRQIGFKVGDEGKNKAEVLELFKKTYGESDANSWFQRWRIFFMSCEVLFGFNRGSEWGVSHYLFEKPQ